MVGRIYELKESVEKGCGYYSPQPYGSYYYSPYNWTSVPETSIGSSSLQHAATVSFTIPKVIPNSAKEILVHAGVYTKNSYGGSNYYTIKVFTQIKSSRYEKYVLIYSGGVNTNSDNMWFPMPPNRRVYITIPTPLGPNSGAKLYAIGYRY